MPALHIRDVPEETLAAIERRAVRHGHSVQQELRDVLEKVTREPIAGGCPSRLSLRTVATGHLESFDRADIYDDDGR